LLAFKTGKIDKLDNYGILSAVPLRSKPEKSMSWIELLDKVDTKEGKSQCLEAG